MANPNKLSQLSAGLIRTKTSTSQLLSTTKITCWERRVSP
jgi:hypothetical protein